MYSSINRFFKNLLFILTLLLNGFIFSQNKSIDDLKIEANKLFENEDYTTAYKLYSQLVANYPKDPVYNFKLGVCMIYSEPDKNKCLPFLTFANSKSTECPPEVKFYLGKAYQSTIAGRNYYLTEIGEKERCMIAISKLLRFGSPLKTKGPEGAEQGTRDVENTGMEGDWAANGGAGGAGGGAAEADTTPDTGGDEGGGEEELAEKFIRSLFKVGLINEAYTEFPKSTKEISNPDIKKLYTALRSASNIQDPISLDPTKPNFVNITRKFKTDKKALAAIKAVTGEDMSKIDVNKIKWNGLTVKFGEGSRGGRGVKSKGLGFEGSLLADLQTLLKKGYTTKNKDEFNHPKLTKEIKKDLVLQKGKFVVQSDASKNQSRPLVFKGGSPEIAFSGGSIAATLTDITVIKGEEKYYISAKYGSTLTFFNSGVTKVFPESEIKKGEIENADGVTLLETLGIDNKSFCAVFNYYAKGKAGKFIPQYPEADKTKLQNLVSSGIGSGYYYAQAGAGEDQFFLIDEAYNNEASEIVGNPKVEYGGNNGKGKRVDVVFESKKYKFKINIRNKQGGLYPSHIMCDYKPK
jgi:tetratricopeptide (TPR) repeat protein